jgi:competence protein ComGA
MNERLLEILRIALAYRVSDIHFSLAENGGTVIEMRVDGKIRQLKSGEKDGRLFHYLMYRANLDVSSVFEPQTGSFEISVDGVRLSLRFAIMSAWQRTSGVLRILNSTSGITINSLCKDETVLGWMKRIPDMKNGLIIFSGPTGSGKTTALYTILDAVKERKIFTLEDPVEVIHENYVQLQVNEKQMGYAEGIRQLMRHDPDIIMIGEIRDSLAANMAVRSALTGHLVVTSLHSFSCVGAIGRMLELGVERAALRSVLRGVSNQRLFMDAQGKRTGIYECLDENGIAYWFEKQSLPEGFKDIETKIAEAASGGLKLL